MLGLLLVRPHFCWGGVGAAKGLLPCFLVPKGNQPTACTLALWWLKFGPTESLGGEGGGTAPPHYIRPCSAPHVRRHLVVLVVGFGPRGPTAPVPPDPLHC